MLKQFRVITALSLLGFINLSTCQLPALADAISPKIGHTPKKYSEERPNTAYFGTGTGGRLSEASHLRFEAEHALNEREFEEAIRLSKKSVHLDPGDPTGHLFLARALTGKFYATKGPVNEELLKECLTEWRLIWFHDSDQFEQTEAKWQAIKLMRIARALDNERKLKAKLALKQQQQQTDKQKLASTPEGENKDAAPENSNTEESAAANIKASADDKAAGDTETPNNPEESQAQKLSERKRKLLFF